VLIAKILHQLHRPCPWRDCTCDAIAAATDPLSQR